MSGPKYLCRKKKRTMLLERRARELPEPQPAALSDADARVLVPSSISSAWSGERTRLRDSSSSRRGLGSRQGVGRLRCAEALVTLEDCAGPFLEAADHHRRCPSMNILVGGTSGSDTIFLPNLSRQDEKNVVPVRDLCLPVSTLDGPFSAVSKPIVES